MHFRMKTRYRTFHLSGVDEVQIKCLADECDGGEHVILIVPKKVVPRIEGVMISNRLRCEPDW